MDEYEAVLEGGSGPSATPTPPTETKEPENKDPDTTKADNPVAAPVEPPKEDLFELPDGRKVDAGTLSKEWKDHFYPEFTRKSQKLAEYERSKPDITKPDDPKEPDYSDPEYEPKSYAEIIEKASEVAERRIREKALAEENKKKEIETVINDSLNELRKIDPDLNDEELFAHAIKYNFSDLKMAHANLKDQKSLILKSKEEEDQRKREAAPVAKPNDNKSVPGDSNTILFEDDGEDAISYLQRIKGK